MELGKAIIEILFQLSGADDAVKDTDKLFKRIQSGSDVAGGARDKLDEKLKNVGSGTRNVKFDVKIAEAQKRLTKLTNAEIAKRQVAHNSAIDKVVAKQKAAADSAIANAKKVSEAHSKKWSSILSDIREESNANKRLSAEKEAAAQREIANNRILEAQRHRAAEIASAVADTRLANRANSIIDPLGVSRTNSQRELAHGIAILEQSQERLGLSQEKFHQGMQNLNREFNTSITAAQKRLTQITEQEIKKRQSAHNNSVDSRIAGEKSASDLVIANAKKETDAIDQKWRGIMSGLRETTEATKKRNNEQKAAAAQELADNQRLAAQRVRDHEQAQQLAKKRLAFQRLADRQLATRQLAEQRLAKIAADARLSRQADGIASPLHAADVSALRERAHGMAILEQSQERLGLSQRKYRQGLKSLNQEYSASLLQFGLYGSALGRQSQLFRDIGFQISDVGRGLTFLGTTLLASLAIPLKSFADFEQATLDVVAVLGDLNTEASRASGFRDLSQTFLELGERTEFTANQIAAAARQLGLAGFSTKEIQDSIASISNLASAGNVSLDRAAKISVNISRAFGIAAKNLGRVSDVLAAVATNSNTTVESLGESFKLASPIAASLGQDLEVIAASIGILGNAGLSGTIAGTGINRFLSELLEKKDKVDALLKGIGSSFDKVDPTKLGLDDIIAEFTKLEQLNLINTETFFSAFDQRSARAVVTLVNQGTESFSKLTKAAKESAGTAEAIRDIRIDSTLGSWQIAISALTTTLIELGNTVEPLARILINKLTSAAKTLTGIIRTYPGIFEAATTAIASMGVAALAAGPALTALGLAIRGLGLLKLGQSMTPIIAKLVSLRLVTLGVTPAMAALSGTISTTGAAAGSLSLTLLGWVGAIGVAVTAVVGLTAALSELYTASQVNSFNSENESFFQKIEEDALQASKTISDLNKQIKTIDDLVGGNDLQSNRFINSDTDNIRESRDELEKLQKDAEDLDKKLFEIFQKVRTDQGAELGLGGAASVLAESARFLLGRDLEILDVSAIEENGEKILRTHSRLQDAFSQDIDSIVDIKFADLTQKEQEIFDLFLRADKQSKELIISIEEKEARQDLLDIVDQDRIDSEVQKIREEAESIQLDIALNEEKLNESTQKNGEDSKESKAIAARIKQQRAELEIVNQRLQLGIKLSKQAESERKIQRQLNFLQEQKSKAVAEAGDAERQRQLDIAGPGAELSDAANAAIETAKANAGDAIDAQVDKLNAAREKDRQRRRKSDQRSKDSIDKAEKEAKEIAKLREKQQKREEDRRIENEGITKEDIEIEKLETKIEQRQVQQNLISELNALGSGSDQLGKTLKGTDDNGNDILDDTRLTELQKKKERDEKALAKLEERTRGQALTPVQKESQNKLSSAISATDKQIKEFIEQSKEEIKVLQQEINDLKDISQKSKDKDAAKASATAAKESAALLKIRQKEQKSLRSAQIQIKKNSLEIAKKNKNLAEELRFTRELAEVENKQTSDAKISEELASRDPNARKAKDQLDKSLEEKLQQDLLSIRKRYAEDANKSTNSVAKSQRDVQKLISEQLAKQVRNRRDALELQKTMVILAGREQAIRLRIARELGKDQSNAIRRIQDGNFSQADKEFVAEVFNKAAIKLPGFDFTPLMGVIDRANKLAEKLATEGNSEKGNTSNPFDLGEIELPATSDVFLNLPKAITGIGSQFEEAISNFPKALNPPVVAPPVPKPPVNTTPSNTENNQRGGDVFVNIENIDADGVNAEEVGEIVCDVFKEKLRGFGGPN